MQKYINHKNKNKYKPNYHNKCIKQIKHSRYKAGYFTKCSFKDGYIYDCYFSGVNLKKNSFKNAKISNCVFIHCNFSKSNFWGCTIDSVYFCGCKFTDCKDIDAIPKTMILRNTNKFKKSILLETYVLSNLADSKYEKNRILTISSKKINVWTLGILLNEFSEMELLLFFKQLQNCKQKKFKTVKDYEDSIENFINKS